MEVGVSAFRPCMDPRSSCWPHQRTAHYHLSSNQVPVTAQALWICAQIHRLLMRKDSHVLWLEHMKEKHGPCTLHFLSKRTTNLSVWAHLQLLIVCSLAMLCAYQCSSLSALKVFNETKVFFGSYSLWMKPCNWEGKLFRKCGSVWCAHRYWLCLFSVLLETYLLLPSVREPNHSGLVDCNNKDKTFCELWLCFMIATWFMLSKWVNMTPAELEDFTSPPMYAILISKKKRACLGAEEGLALHFCHVRSFSLGSCHGSLVLFIVLCLHCQLIVTAAECSNLTDGVYIMLCTEVPWIITYLLVTMKFNINKPQIITI